MRKIVLTYGLIAGAVLALVMIVEFAFPNRIGFHSGAIVGYTSMVIAFLMVYFGVRAYRDNVAGGRIGFGRALMVGLLITAVACVCYVGTWEVIFYKVTPDFADKYAAYAVDKVRHSGATEAQIAAKVKEMAQFKEMYKNPLVNVALTFLEPLPVGIVFTLVTAGVLSRKRRQEATAAA